jgi:VWFA-related protein
MPKAEMPKWSALAAAALISAVTFGLRPSAFGIRSSAFGIQQPVYRSTADLVEVDAIVTDRGGRFVRDLRLGEIEVLEDGRPQRLHALYLVERGVAIDASAGAPAVDARQGGSTQVRRAFFFLIDQEHLTPGSLNRVRTGVERFLTSDFRDGQDLASLYATGADGQVRMTTAREELLTAVRRIKPRSDLVARAGDMRDWPRIINEAEALRIDQGDEAVLRAAVMRACADEQVRNCAEQADLLLREKSKRLVREADAATNRTLQTLSTAAKGLARLEGRKTLVFLTEGFSADAYRAQLRLVTGDAGRAGVAIYVVDARGLDKSGRSIQDRPPPDLEGLVSSAFDTREDPGDQLANGTGGLVIRNLNDGAKAIAAIAADTGTYYVIGYTPEDRTFDGRFRQIEVRVKRDGVVVRARRGYVATPRATPLLTAGPATAPASGTNVPEALPSTSIVSTAELPATRPDANARVRELVELSRTSSNPLEASRVAPSAAASAAASRGWSRYEQGDLEGAAREFADATAIPGAPAWVYYAQGQAEFGLRRFADAIARWEHVRSIVPEFEPVYFDLVDGYLRLDRAREAISVLRAAERRWPTDADVYNALGVVQIRRGSIDDAVESFAKAVKAEPESALGYFNLGRAHEMRYARSRRYVATTGGWVGSAEDRREAVAQYRKYLELGGPFEQSARDGLARLEWK